MNSNNLTRLVTRALTIVPKYQFQFPQGHSETHGKVENFKI